MSGKLSKGQERALIRAAKERYPKIQKLKKNLKKMNRKK
jgi:hypothetical protein